MKRRILLPAIGALIGIGLLAVPTLIEPEPRLIYNPSPSAAIGWYGVHPGGAFGRGDLVASQLPGEARALADARGYLPSDVPVIKTVWAVAGDEICWQDGEAHVAGRPPLRLRAGDSQGRPLPRPPDGCITLGAGEIFLVSNRTETSFDSRYFGPVHTSLVIGPVRYIGSSDVQAGAAKDGPGAWARAQGADCKIKGLSANKGPAPCLHITFHGATRLSAALGIADYFHNISGLARRYFTALHKASRQRRP